MQVGNI